MGTTVTAALVGDETIAVGHVGDSRAYRVRGDEIEQLTDDHSLVADLVRSGRLTSEEADSHPQRSVITRALGTDLDVDVDTFLVAPEDGDIYLLCSDGLTTMVPGPEILRIIRESDGLEPAARALVKAANRSGGEDNITVVLFSVAGDGELPEEDGDTAVLDDTLVGLEPITIAEPPSGNGWETIEHAQAAKPHPGRRRLHHRRLIIGTAIALVVAALIAAALWGLANAYFVGAEEDGRIAVYQGLPYDLGGGVSLYRVRYVSRLDAAQLSEEERAQLLDHDLMGYDDARARLVPFEAEALPGQ
jgi:protein phosphatase